MDDAAARVRKAKARLAAQDRRARKLIARENKEEHSIRKLGRAGPTAETKRRLRPHSMELMLDRGVLTGEQVHALDQIARAYAAITWDVHVRLSVWERVDSGRSRQGETPGEILLVERYNRWCELVKARGLQAAIGIVLDVAVDGLSLNEIARHRQMDKRTVKSRLLEAADLYREAASQNRSR